MTTSSSLRTSTGQADTEKQGNPPPVDAEMRSSMIAGAAYYRAEARGFATGYELDDWLAAETETDLSLAPIRA
jgi:hypothetical protein